MERPDPPLPTFLIIGAQKSATRWLRANLGEHPDIFTASQEISFWNHQPKVSRWGLDWYRQQFEGWDGEPVVGEATPGYMIWRHDPLATSRRIGKFLPGVQLIALLRNPIDRANSALRHHQRRGRISPKTKLVKAVRKRKAGVRRLGLVEAGLYAQSLDDYVHRFGWRMLILLHDDVVADPREVYRRTLQHVGADQSFVPPSVDEMMFSNQPVFKGSSELSFEDRLTLWEYFRDDVSRLQDLIHRDLSMWDPNIGDPSRFAVGPPSDLNGVSTSVDLAPPPP